MFIVPIKTPIREIGIQKQLKAFGKKKLNKSEIKLTLTQKLWQIVPSGSGGKEMHKYILRTRILSNTPRCKRQITIYTTWLFRHKT